jgi:hypothetical protein
MVSHATMIETLSTLSIVFAGCVFLLALVVCIIMRNEIINLFKYIEEEK